MDTFANSEYPEENNPAPEASFDAPQEPQNEAPQEPRNEVPQEHQSEPQSGTYHAADHQCRNTNHCSDPYHGNRSPALPIFRLDFKARCLFHDFSPHISQIR